jgi:hypothetical protein
MRDFGLSQRPWRSWRRALPSRIHHSTAQARTLVRAIEALGVIEPTGPIERLLALLLLAACKRRVRAIVEIAPS